MEVRTTRLATRGEQAGAGELHTEHVSWPSSGSGPKDLWACLECVGEAEEKLRSTVETRHRVGLGHLERLANLLDGKGPQSSGYEFTRRTIIISQRVRATLMVV